MQDMDIFNRWNKYSLGRLVDTRILLQAIFRSIDKGKELSEYDGQHNLNDGEKLSDDNLIIRIKYYGDEYRVYRNNTGYIVAERKEFNDKNNELYYYANGKEVIEILIPLAKDTGILRVIENGYVKFGTKQFNLNNIEFQRIIEIEETYTTITEIEPKLMYKLLTLLYNKSIRIQKCSDNYVDYGEWDNKFSDNDDCLKFSSLGDNFSLGVKAFKPLLLVVNRYRGNKYKDIKFHEKFAEYISQEKIKVYENGMNQIIIVINNEHLLLINKCTLDNEMINKIENRLSDSIDGTDPNNSKIYAILIMHGGKLKQLLSFKHKPEIQDIIDALYKITNKKFSVISKDELSCDGDVFKYIMIDSFLFE